MNRCNSSFLKDAHLLNRLDFLLGADAGILYLFKRHNHTGRWIVDVGTLHRRVIEIAVLLDESIVGSIQLLAQFIYRRLFGVRVHFCEHQRVQGVLDFEVAFQALELIACADFYGSTVLILVDLAVLLIVFKVARFLICTCLEVRLDGVERAFASTVNRLVDILRQFVHCLGEVLSNVGTFAWLDLHDIIAVLVAPGRCLADDILWMVLEILVDRYAAIRISAPIRLREHLREVLEILRVRRLHLVLAALAEDDNIRADIRARLTKCTRGQLVRGYHVGFLADVFAHPRSILAVGQ